MAYSEEVTKAQLSSLDDTDCYASIWGEILSKQRESCRGTDKINNGNLWGGRGKGGRGLSRRTVQPKDVVVEGVRMQYLLGETCLDGATIKLLNGHVYCLVGRNGCGKSTLLKKIHSQKIPGWSVQWSSLYFPPALPLERQHMTPLQILSAYMDECKRDSQTATESLMDEIQERLDALNLDSEQDEMERLCEELSTLEENLSYFDDEHHRISSDLFQEFGVDRHQQQQPCEELPPEKQKIVLLCVALLCCQFTNLLLMDEPANGLDARGLVLLRHILEEMRESYPSITVVVVSHDVDLINDVATDIIDMHAKKLWYYAGCNYDSYRLMREQKEASYLKQSLAMEKKSDRLMNSLQNLKEKPTPKRRGGAKKKARSIASHRKKIERHNKEKQTLDSSSLAMGPSGGKALSATQRLKLAQITKSVPDKAVQFVLPTVSSRWGEPLITAFDVGYCAEENAAKGKNNDHTAPDHCEEAFTIIKRDGYLFDCVDLCIEEGSCTCILGPSISASCLMNILAKRIAPTEGTVQHPSGVRVGFCDSCYIDEMMSNVDEAITALEFLARRYPKKTEKDIRGHLTAFGLSPASQAKTPLICLSGGETFRLAFSKIMLDDLPVIFLENPTSHLDVESVQALAYGMRQWNGTIVMVCSDANFLRSLDDVKCVIIVPEEGKIRRIYDDDRGIKGMDAYLRTL